MTLIQRTALFLMLPLSVTVWAQSSSTPAQAPTTPPQTAPAQQAPPKAAATDDLPDTPSATAQIVASPEPTGPTIVLDTTMGRLSCRLFAKETPVTVANFIGLAEGTKEFTDPKTEAKKKGVHFYDGTTFHRVIPDFMIQGGDRAGDGSGDPGYFFQDEINPGLRFDRPGRLAMANSGPATNGSQFFITEAPVDHLNGKHTIFGQCDAHTVLMVQSIARVDRNSNDKPLTPVVINKVTVVREGQQMPPEPAPQPAAAAPVTQ